MRKAIFSLAAAISAGFAAPAAAYQPAFQTPSGNILCYVDNTASVLDMVCLIFRADWEKPADPPGQDCDADRVRALVMAPDLEPTAISICHSDVFWPYPAPVLGYGSTWMAEGFACKIERTGVTCSDTRSVRSYTLARAGYTLN